MPRLALTYAKAGVDRAKIKATHIAMAKKLEATFRARKGKLGEPIYPIGHYAGLIDLGDNRVLSLHTDSVGTKVIIAQMMKRYDTIGIDCVAMCANDLICTGSEPIAFLDYLAVSRPSHTIVAQIADGIVEGAKQADMAVVGGETAVVPELLSKDHGTGLDLVGMGVGMASKDELVLGDKVQNGDALIGLASSGIHSNGLTLARKVLLKNHKIRDKVPELNRSLGEELLEPTRIYVRPVMEALRKLNIHGLAHITGGAFSKLSRITEQANLGATLDNFPPPPAIFPLIQKEGRVPGPEMYRTFNMGVGFVAICPEGEVDAAIRLFKRHGQTAFSLGHTQKRTGIWVKGIRIG